MRGRLLSLVLMVFIGAAPAAAEKQDESPTECPAHAARVDRDKSSTAAWVPVPGQLVSYAIQRLDGGKQRALLLVGPREADRDDTDPVRAVIKKKVLAAMEAGEISVLDEPRRAATLSILGIPQEGADVPLSCRPQDDPAAPTLVELDLDGDSPTLIPLRGDLGDGARAVSSIDLDADGTGEILLERDGELVLLPPDGTTVDGGEAQVLLSDPELRLRTEEPREIRFPIEPVAVRSPLDDETQLSPRRDRQGPLLAPLPPASAPLHLQVTGLGALKLYGPDEGSGPWRLRARVPLPTRSNLDPSLLLVASPQVRTVGTPAAGHLLLAAGPVPYGEARLRTMLIEIDDLDNPTVQDVWSRLPESEYVNQSGYFLLDGEPFLWVVADDDEDMELFGGYAQALRIFRLRADRTRAGLGPVLSFDKMKEFQQTRMIQGRDVNDDGRDDLLFIARDDGVFLSAYLQNEDGTFGRSVRRQRIEQDSRLLAYGEDLDGDGLADLLVSGKDEIRIHAGVPPAVRGQTLKLVSSEPRWAAGRRPSTVKAPGLVRCSDREGVIADLDGDGRGEWLCSGSDLFGRPYFKVIRFDRKL